jgi:hypothetical protein
MERQHFKYFSKQISHENIPECQRMVLSWHSEKLTWFNSLFKPRMVYNVNELARCRLEGIILNTQIALNLKYNAEYRWYLRRGGPVYR